VHTRGGCAHQLTVAAMVERRTRAPHPLPLEPKHSRAICNEIGERLHHHLARDAARVPPRLRKLLRRFAELEGGAIIRDGEDEPETQVRPGRFRFWRFS